MKRSENLIATLLVIYGILCAINIALYALMQVFVEDKSTATNLLIWSATIFAPIAVLMTYTNWKEQRKAEEIAKSASKLFSDLNGLNSYIMDIVQSQNPKARIQLLDKEVANSLLKKFEYKISIHIGDLIRIKKYCGNDKYSGILDKFLLETYEVHEYITYSAWEINIADYHGLDLSNYYHTYREMRDCLYEISIYEN